MNIAIISREKIENRKFWSGTIANSYSILKSEKNFKIIKIENFNNKLRKIYALKREYFKLRNIKFDETYNLKVSQDYAKQINKQISKYSNIDYIIVFEASLIAYLRSPVPIIFWTDLLYSDYYKHYFRDKKIHYQTVKNIRLIEKKALLNCKYVFLSSLWAVRKAKQGYKKLNNKFKLLRFGPNFKINYKNKFIKKQINAKQNKILRLITLSVDWERKGIDKIIELKKIIEKKVNVEIIIVGAKQKFIKSYDKEIKFLRFINKNNAYGEKKLSKLFFKSHFHILFSKAEAYGISLLEANMHGVPNITSSVGAINEIIKNNVNGKKFEVTKNLNKVAKYIIDIFNNEKKYNKLCYKSYIEYEKNYSKKQILKKLKFYLN